MKNYFNIIIKKKKIGGGGWGRPSENDRQASMNFKDETCLLTELKYKNYIACMYILGTMDVLKINNYRVGSYLMYIGKLRMEGRLEKEPIRKNFWGISF